MNNLHTSMRKRIDAGCDLWKQLSKSIYATGLSLGETHKKVCEQYPVSFIAMKRYLQEQKLTRSPSIGFQKKEFERICVNCKNMFIARSPTTLMCDMCAGSDRLKSYIHWRLFQTRFKQFGVDKVKFEQMLIDQHGTCGLCNQKLTIPCLDHCHLTGLARGLLCNRCNLTLGQIEKFDAYSWLNRAIMWLDRTKKGG